VTIQSTVGPVIVVRQKGGGGGSVTAICIKDTSSQNVQIRIKKLSLSKHSPDSLDPHFNVQVW